MNCPEARDLFSDHLDGTLEPIPEDELGRHFATCRACREALRLYQEPLAAMGGAAPPPPPELPDRIARALQAELRPARPVRRLLYPLPLAAGLAMALLGYWLGTHPSSTGTPAGSIPVYPAGCATELARLGALEPGGLRSPLDGESPVRILATGSLRVVLPGSLLSHGPYDPQVERAIHQPRTACLPLAAPYGDVLVLTLSRPEGASPPEGTFRVEPDPSRVFYTRVHWLRDGLTWTLEGRAAAPELLDLATEIATGAMVERI